MSVITLEPVQIWLFEVTMIHKKPTILYLLILCIAMTPMLSVNASATGHLVSMSSDCIDSDMNGSGSLGVCDDTQCVMSIEACCTPGGAGYIPVLLWAPDSILPFAESRPSSITQFQSRLEFSIFRPPIS